MHVLQKDFMSGFLFMGVTITPDSRQGETPQAWQPSATLHSAAGKELGSVTDARCFASKTEADEAALRLARRHIREHLHQG